MQEASPLDDDSAGVLTGIEGGLADLTDPSLIFLATSLQLVNENIETGTYNLPILRTGSLVGAVDVTYRTIPVTALDGQDFIGVSGVVRFEDGESEKRVPITIIDDTSIEGTERFDFVLQQAEGSGSLGVPTTQNVYIVDVGDTAFSQFFTLSQASTPSFEQDRSDSFTTAPVLVTGTSHRIPGSAMNIDGVAPDANLEFRLTADPYLLYIGLDGGFGSINNLYAFDPNGLNLFASPFRDVEVMSVGGPNVIILDQTQRGRVNLGDSNDTLVVSIETDGGAALGPENTFYANLGGGNDEVLINETESASRLVIDAGEGDDVAVVEGMAEVRMTGGQGNDVMILSAGAHTLVIEPEGGHDIVGGFISGRDVLELVGVDPEQVTYEFWSDTANSESGTLLRYGGGDDFVLLVGTPFSQFSNADLVFV